METHNYTKQEIQQMFAEIALSQKETSKKFKETDKKFQETDKKIQATDKLLKSVAKQLGNIGANNGAVAEDFFFYGFSASMEVNQIKYDYIEHNKVRIYKRLRGEYDIVLINGDSLLVIEVKYRGDGLN